MKEIKHKQTASHTTNSSKGTDYKTVVKEAATEVKAWPDWKKIGTNTTRADNQWQKRTFDGKNK
jgi:hypothetical protein